MQSANFDLDDFISVSMEGASRMFRSTDQYKLLKENSEQASRDLKLNFCEDDYKYIEAYLEIILQAESQETEFLYHQAYRDCVELLKQF